MQIMTRTSYFQLKTDPATQAIYYSRSSIPQHSCIRDQNSITAQPLFLSIQEGQQVRTTDFFLPLQPHLHIHRQSTNRSQVTFQGLQVDKQLPLIIACPSCKEIL